MANSIEADGYHEEPVLQVHSPAAPVSARRQQLLAVMVASDTP
jgi:hypothetical protein